ncbi:ParB/RepB/Spo0J family partition protein [Pontibacter sp. BT731]|uniref:ParB/RepB/Spo0J family partition protein n=1 Tax=Pontibacter coccineus TaxID=3063328 RepID=UPI0026E4287E|nr:ParB/RepB/Spo0J family partition protein [Pontibacter sp. BT731]MDO6389015.1 ParB/RepB/Spo0J family partition protein [Pontibacter sp. BT731]
MIQRDLINIELLEYNEGQIPGVPENPRFIKDEEYAYLLDSIREDPDYIEAREVIVFPFKGKYVAIGGNQRLRGCKELGYTVIPCKLLPPDTPAAKLKRWAIKDNGSYGQNDWDALGNDWDDLPLKAWGLAVPFGWGEDTQEEEAEQKPMFGPPTMKIEFETELQLKEARTEIEELFRGRIAVTIK